MGIRSGGAALSARTRIYLASALVLATLVSLSWVSSYALPTDLEITPDIALMLTPAGILENLVLAPTHVLREYYHQPTDRSGFAANYVVLWLALALLAESAALLYWIRREANTR